MYDPVCDIILVIQQKTIFMVVLPFSYSLPRFFNNWDRRVAHKLDKHVHHGVFVQMDYLDGIITSNDLFKPHKSSL